MDTWQVSGYNYIYDGIDTVKTNPFEPGVDNPGMDETGEQMEMGNLNMDTSTSSSSRSTVISRHSTQEETSFGSGISDTTPFLPRTANIDAWERIKRKFPNANTTNSPFTASIDGYDRVMVRLNRDRGKYHLLFKTDGKLNDKLPQKNVDSLGPPAEEIVETNRKKIARNQEKIDELREQLATTSYEHVREGLNQFIAEEQDAINQLERANEVIEERMTLRDRVKTIFKKYGFTVLAVASAVGVVIGVIVANLKNGLTSLGKGVGNGLKTISKKLGEILPGLVGAIASFALKTAGEVVGFLAKNAWLLIVVVVIYLVEQFKKK